MEIREVQATGITKEIKKERTMALVEEEIKTTTILSRWQREKTKIMVQKHNSNLMSFAYLP